MPEPAGRRPAGQRLILAAAATVSLTGVLLIGFGLSGLLTPAPEAAPSPAAHKPTATRHRVFDVPPGHVAKPMKAARPVAVYIPAIGVAAPLMELGLDAEGAIENPPFQPPNLAGWYRYGPVPGQRGAAVITGHLDSRTGPAVFASLRDVRKGDQIQVMRADRSVAVFVVDKVEHTPKRSFPTRKVYGKVGYPALRVITCGGAFDRATGSYRENTIVYAHLALAHYPGRS
ncbi:class F sortase [Thermoactinospora rubra]|uniref:class F sortase n=1 Tax=Thermoactinospora rubra TaxID=1088767 RepID=UPI001981E127|nr:class F sortase [Thermoactinospora rubra]